MLALIKVHCLTLCFRHVFNEDKEDAENDQERKKAANKAPEYRRNFARLDYKIETRVVLLC